MKTLLKKMLGDTAGASAAEYALILAVVGIGVVVSFQALGTSIGNVVTSASTKIVAP